ncbi:hypothetical protein DICPUDRAFT_97356 [Dictyostelium purpureum]|uniref:Dolichol kinase n=1 Tax=Dictyostelium purpureum TaxID=5786 RepID=F0ZG15_DICPU|nr:uncharacterized protein DICPUDRAFT_97356 [Dictyostelium purpureum]EGC37078.1 hypothetical protein DICPUDRAFT_97356 [Dictyostelium purpureum]|eukprot:XP_003286359.1 hypothetical protein DICPUDRAFT_97356 [Dictyostelium purpureum]
MGFINRKQLSNSLRYIGVGVKRIPRVIKELKRKGFHFFGLVIPIIYILGLHYTTFMTRGFAVKLLGSITLGYFIWEQLRLNVPAVSEFCVKMYGHMMREKEKDRMNGVFFYLLGSTICIYFFHPLIAVSSMLFLIIGDFTAALVGISYGRTKIGNKSLEGTMAMFLVCFVLSFAMFFNQSLGEHIAFWGSLVATLVELFNPSFVDDNLTIPIIGAIAMKYMTVRLGVELPVYSNSL